MSPAREAEPFPRCPALAQLSAGGEEGEAVMLGAVWLSEGAASRAALCFMRAANTAPGSAFPCEVSGPRSALPFFQGTDFVGGAEVFGCWSFDASCGRQGWRSPTLQHPNKWGAPSSSSPPPPPPPRGVGKHTGTAPPDPSRAVPPASSPPCAPPGAFLGATRQLEAQLRGRSQTLQRGQGWVSGVCPAAADWRCLTGLRGLDGSRSQAA